LQNPADPEDESRDWIGEAWRYLLARDQGLPATEPSWLDAPAVAQVSISTPRLLGVFSTWNEGKLYAESVKPFGFMLVAYARPRRRALQAPDQGPADPPPGRSGLGRAHRQGEQSVGGSPGRSGEQRGRLPADPRGRRLVGGTHPPCPERVRGCEDRADVRDRR